MGKRNLRCSKIKGKPFFVVILLVAAAVFAASTLSPQEKHGKHIYLKTTSPSGKEIKAYIGIASTEAPGSVMACANCHGYDGLGRPEGGINPTNITWKELTTSYGLSHDNGRKHPAYTEETLVKAITKGIDPAGNKLDSAMPHYSMPDEDMAALVAYLKRLGSESDPGISEKHIRIGTFLPSEGAYASLGAAMEATLQAYFAEVSEKGGIYGRSVELVVGRGKSRLTREQFSKFLQEQDMFALVSTFLPELDREIPDLLDLETVPLIGPFTLFPATELALNRYVFYILSGLREQARVLIKSAAAGAGVKTSQLTILYPARADLKELTESLRESEKERGWREIKLLEYPSAQFDAAQWIRQMQKDKTDYLLFFGVEPETRALFRAIDEAGWAPTLLLPGVLIGEGIAAIPPAFREKVLIAYPSLSQDRKEQTLREFNGLVQKYKLPTDHVGAQLSAYAAAEILIEALRRSGREVSREKFVTTLEKMFEFDTGLTPPVSYDSNRRIGALGAYIVSVGTEKENVKFNTRWVNLD